MKELVPLYGRVPIGVGTPLLESLTSFIGRLAIARNLTSSRVFNHLMLPLIPKYRLRKQSRFLRLSGSDGAVYDGLGKPAEDAVSALTVLTGLENLSLQTMLPWRPLVSAVNSRAIRHKQKRWCASCLADWRYGTMGAPTLARGIGFPMPRSSDAIFGGVSHLESEEARRQWWMSIEVRCESFQGLFQETVPFGSCRKCGHYLEVGDQWSANGSMVSLESEEARRQWWMSIEVGRMLAFQSTVSASASPEGFPSMLKRAVSLAGAGSVKGLERYLGVDHASFTRWLSGTKRPTLESFLLVCMRLSVDPLHVAIFPRREAWGECAYPKGEARPRWPRITRAADRSCRAFVLRS